MLIIEKQLIAIWVSIIMIQISLIATATRVSKLEKNKRD